LNSFIVRIYRHGQNDRGNIVGTVEDVEKQSRGSFTNLDELWDILNPTKRERSSPMEQKKAIKKIKP